MGRLNELLCQIGRGEIDVTAAAPEVRALCRARAYTPNLDDTMMRMAGVLDDRDPTDTFVEVSAAWMGGPITDEDHAVLYKAVADRPFRVTERCEG